jgi:hypothetical protein
MFEVWYTLFVLTFRNNQKKTVTLTSALDFMKVLLIFLLFI